MDREVMHIFRACLGTMLVLAIGHPGPAAGAEPAPATQRGSHYWRELVEADFQVPEGERAVDLLLEMDALLASPDPWLRDEVAYSAAVRWIFADPVLSDDELRQVMGRWLGNLGLGPGESAADAVLRRSFSALCLSIVAARDLREPFLSQAEFDGLLDGTLGYLASERDLRGFDPQLGWIHGVAHTADVLKFLARSPRLPAAAQSRILAALDARLMTADEVFVWGENARLAEVIASIVGRADFDRTALDHWLSAWLERHRALWSGGPLIEPERFVRVQNGLQVLRSLYVALAMQGVSPPAEAAREAVLDTVAKMR
jgi:hypothetical protein